MEKETKLKDLEVRMEILQDKVLLTVQRAEPLNDDLMRAYYSAKDKYNAERDKYNEYLRK